MADTYTFRGHRGAGEKRVGGHRIVGGEAWRGQEWRIRLSGKRGLGVVCVNIK